MKCYSTQNPKGELVDIKTAVMRGLAPDDGLYMPETIPSIDFDYDHLSKYSFQEIAFTIAKKFLAEEIPTDTHLLNIVEDSIDFPAPVRKLKSNISLLELFHGPTMAFKDFGARFMARLMSFFNRGENEKIFILVATSGDTGGAVASGFYDVPGIEVIILYPSGGVSVLQEKQLTTWGRNIRAIEVNGVFDDCQRLVKQAFLDHDIRSKFRLSSANSINLARLIPQSFYYFEGYKQLITNNAVVYVVPSGNYGNLSAGVMAQQMGLPIDHFIAATNVNRPVPDYLETGKFNPRSSLSTISNAMDVGNPSNFVRLLDLHGSTWNQIKKNIKGISTTDKETLATIDLVYRQFGYLLDPHGAVGYHAIGQIPDEINNEYQYLLLETAHPAKFKDSIESRLSIQIEMPQRLVAFNQKIKEADSLSNEYSDFKEWILSSLK